MKWRLLLLLVFSFPSLMNAVHIVGGEMIYEHISGTEYLVTLKIYRDCNGGGAAFDGAPGSQNPAHLGIFDGDNNYVTTYDMPPPTITNIDASLSGLCESIFVPACVEEGVYTYSINLPANSSGYQLVYQRCCRNSTILNIVSPEDTGNTIVAFVPPTSDFSDNSSPEFNNFPPVALCLNNPLEFDHSATDIDGDELVYSFCTPYTGASSTVPQPFPPSSPDYDNIVWASGYNENYQIAASPAFSIDPQTGMLTGTPTQQGQFVIGICVKEYRDGVFVSEVRRDFQFNVLICPGQPSAVFSESSTLEDCTSTVDFNNSSLNGQSYFWDFGDGNTSTQEEPSHTYLEGGTYDVLLITYGSNDCADSTTTTVTLEGIPNPVINDPVFECINNEGTYSVSMEPLNINNLDYEWYLDAMPDFDNSTINVDNIVNLPPGDHTISVTVINDAGCEGEDAITFTVNPSPIANFSSDSGPCSGQTVEFLNQSSDATNISWDFDFSDQPSANNQDAVTVEFPQSGIYNISITASGEQVCSNTYTEEIEVSENIFVTLDMPDPQCQEGNSSDFVPEGNFATPATFQWLIEDAENILPNAPSQNNIHVNQGGAHVVQLIMTDFNNCEFTISDEFITIDPLVVHFETQGDGCLPYSAIFDNNTTGGSGLQYQWNFGDGQTSTDFTPIHTYNAEGTFDVSLTVNSTIGCIEEASYSLDSIITTYPSPETGFEVNPISVSIIDPSIDITSMVEDGSCHYYISDESNYESCDFSHTFSDAGLFDITQFVTNEFGCSASTTQTIRVNGHVFYAPTAITMNDDGLNDFFKTHILGEIVEFELRIYDRWGEIIFETQDPDTYWRPKYSHDGQYSYQVRIRDSYNTAVVYQGSFITVR